MLRSKTVPIVLLPLALSACGASRSPVPLVGGSTDISALTGEWAGEYSSAESGRSGSISFTLRAAGDSAFGDVVMIPRAWGRALVPWRSEEHTSELQSHGLISYAVFCLKKKNNLAAPPAPVRRGDHRDDSRLHDCAGRRNSMRDYDHHLNDVHLLFVLDEPPPGDIAKRPYTLSLHDALPI